MLGYAGWVHGRVCRTVSHIFPHVARLSVALLADALGCGGLGDCEDLRRPSIATAFLEPCDPRGFTAGRRDDYLCCSDDPSAADGLVPDYESLALPDGVGSSPLFAGDRASWSAWGQCTIKGFEERNSDLGGCPRPCNPRWSAERIALVCQRPGDLCCPTIPTQATDCVFVDGRWRAIRGSDLASPEAWIVDEPGTRQDPALDGCGDWATVDGRHDVSRFADCVKQLSAADQRGFCVPDTEGSCPGSEAIETVDPCEARNQ